MTIISFKGKTIGLTGGIGSGKDTLAELFESWGALILDADKTAKAVVQKGTDGYKKVVKLFGEIILDTNGEIDRKKVASIVFEHPKNLKILELIIHPLILKEDKEKSSLFLANNPQGIIIKNSPLLIEVGLNQACYKTILVVTDEKRRLKRVKSLHPNWKVHDIKARIQAQMNDKDKAKQADFVIENNGRIIELYENAEAIFKQYF